MTAILYVVNDYAVEKFGAKYLVRHIDSEPQLIWNPHPTTKLMQYCDFIIRFSEGDNPTYIKNRTDDRQYHSYKEMSWMLLKAKEYGSIKTN